MNAISDYEYYEYYEYYEWRSMHACCSSGGLEVQEAQGSLRILHMQLLQANSVCYKLYMDSSNCSHLTTSILICILLSDWCFLIAKQPPKMHIVPRPILGPLQNGYRKWAGTRLGIIQSM